MAQTHNDASLQPCRESAVCQCLVSAMQRTRPIVVSTWPGQAIGWLELAGCPDHTTSAAHLAAESAELLRCVERRLAGLEEELVANGANATYELLGAERGADVSDPAQAAALMQLHRSLISSVWALVLPGVAGELSADEIAFAHDALVHATRRSLGFLPEP